MYRKFGKRVLDICLAAAGLIVLSPVLVVVGALVALNLGLPIMFLQQRGGYRCRPFDVIKFRSMTSAVGPAGQLRTDAERLTRFGQILRALSLDELPELWNVLKGEMSLVGPRPFIFDYMELYSPEQRRRHDVRPGITGWAQINGRNNLSWEERFELDVWYVDHQSFALDLKILVLTIVRVFRRDGINSHGEVTMSRFKG